MAGTVHSFRSPLTFAQLRRVTVAWPMVVTNKLSAPEAMDALAEILSAVLEKTPEEINAISLEMNDIAPILDAVAVAAGMVPKDSQLGEAKAGKG